MYSNSSDLNGKSKEVLFEVWDSGYSKEFSDSANGELFLGLGIVSVEELLIIPNQRHVIPLQVSSKKFFELHLETIKLHTYVFS